MQVQKFGLVDWEARGKRAAELEFVSGIEILKSWRTDDGLVKEIWRVFLKPEPEEFDDEDDEIRSTDDVELVIASIQGEERTYIENNYRLVYVGYFDAWRPGGIWFRNPGISRTADEQRFIENFKKVK